MIMPVDPDGVWIELGEVNGGKDETLAFRASGAGEY